MGIDYALMGLAIKQIRESRKSNWANWLMLVVLASVGSSLESVPFRF